VLLSIANESGDGLENDWGIQKVSSVPKKWLRLSREHHVLDPDEDPIRIREQVLFPNNRLELSEVVDHVTFTSGGSGFQGFVDESPRLGIRERRSLDLGGARVGRSVELLRAYNGSERPLGSRQTAFLGLRGAFYRSSEK
jgi:hypothetical protein